MTARHLLPRGGGTMTGFRGGRRRSQEVRGAPKGGRVQGEVVCHRDSPNHTSPGQHSTAHVSRQVHVSLVE